MLGELVGLAGVPVIVALVEVAKRSWPAMDGRWVPLLTLALGLAINAWAGLVVGIGLHEALALGLVAGLAASGLYSQGKALLGSGGGGRADGSGDDAGAGAPGPEGHGRVGVSMDRRGA
jgi:hypothetical protein